MNCKNCGTEVTLNYCPNCGQSAELNRINGHYIVHEIQHVLHPVPAPSLKEDGAMYRVSYHLAPSLSGNEA